MQDETTANEPTAPVEPTNTTINIPVTDGNEPQPEATPDETPVTPATEEPAPAPAEEQPIRPLGPSGQSQEAAIHNNGPAPVGKIIIQKTIKELEDELDGGAFKSIDDFVKAHWEAQDANVQRLAIALRMEANEVWGVIKGLGVKLPQGM